MKFNKAKLLAIVIVCLLAVAILFTGCGKDEDTSTPDTNKTNAPTPEVVKLGFLTPITGGDAAEGAAARNAFQMAIDQANASGGFPYTIEVFVADDQSTENIAIAGTQTIVADPLIVAASGFYNSSPAAAAIPLFIEAEMPLLIWGAVNNSLTSEENVPWITRSVPTDKQENTQLANMALDEMGYTDWFVFSDEGAYGSGNFEAFMAELAARNIIPIGSEQVPQDTTDLSAVVQKIKTSGAKAVYCGSTVVIGSQLKRQLYEAGVTDILFCGISGIKTKDFLILDSAVAEGVLAVSPGIILEESETGRKFVEDYNAQGYTEPIGTFTPYAYESARILLNALRSCGNAPTAELMTEAILNSETIGIMGRTSFDEIGQTTNAVSYLNVIQDGEWVPYKNSQYAFGMRRLGGK